MGPGILAESAAMAAGTGLSCGSCCGSGTGVMLSGYLMTHVKKFPEVLQAFLCFFVGKILAVMALCLSASLLGMRLISETGTVGPVPVKAVTDTLMILIGVGLLIQWIKERRQRKHPDTGKNACLHCHHQHGKRPGKTLYPGALFGMGVCYGASPCAPLFLMLGYTATQKPSVALFTGGGFALCTSLSPLLILLLLSGVLAKRVYQELPEQINRFRLVCYLSLVLYYCVDLIQVCLLPVNASI